MPTKNNVNIEVGTLIVTDESGKTFELGEFSEMEYKGEFEHIKLDNEGSIEFTIKMSLKTRLRFKWEVFKAKRRMKKLIKALYDDGKPHELTVTVRGAKNG